MSNFHSHLIDFLFFFFEVLLRMCCTEQNYDIVTNRYRSNSDTNFLHLRKIFWLRLVFRNIEDVSFLKDRLECIQRARNSNLKRGVMSMILNFTENLIMLFKVWTWALSRIASVYNCVLKIEGVFWWLLLTKLPLTLNDGNAR